MSTISIERQVSASECGLCSRPWGSFSEATPGPSSCAQPSEFVNGDLAVTQVRAQARGAAGALVTVASSGWQGWPSSPKPGGVPQPQAFWL